MALKHSIRFLAEDIWDTPEDGKRYEVIDGELYVSPPPTEPDQRGSANLFAPLWIHVRSNGLGRVYYAPIGVVLDPDDGVQPDIVYVSNERLGIITDRGIFGAPDLIVEVLSPSTRGRDRGIKMRRYAKAGVAHYWMLDPRSLALQVYRLGARGYDAVATFGPGMAFGPELFPGLVITIDDLWR